MAKKIHIKKEHLIGGVIIIILVLFLWGISFLKNNTFLNKQIEFVGIYERVNGLLVDNPVLIHGIKVGKVKEMGLCKGKIDKVYVRVMLFEDLEIPSNSSIMVMSSDLLGSKVIEIVPGDSKTFAQNGDTLQTEVSKTLQEEVSLQVLPIKKKAEELMSSLDTLISSIQTILNENTRENLRKTIESIRYAIANIEETSYNVDTLVRSEKRRIIKILENIESISGNLRSDNKKIDNIISNFSLISDSLAKAHIGRTFINASKTLNDFSIITDKINNGKGSIGLLINNDTLYNNLEKSSDELRKLLQDMRLNPKRYVHFSVFGKGDKKNKSKQPQ